MIYITLKSILNWLKNNFASVIGVVKLQFPNGSYINGDIAYSLSNNILYPKTFTELQNILNVNDSMIIDCSLIDLNTIKPITITNKNFTIRNLIYNLSSNPFDTTYINDILFDISSSHITFENCNITWDNTTHKNYLLQFDNSFITINDSKFMKVIKQTAITDNYLINCKNNTYMQSNNTIYNLSRRYFNDSPAPFTLIGINVENNSSIQFTNVNIDTNTNNTNVYCIGVNFSSAKDSNFINNSTIDSAGNSDINWIAIKFFKTIDLALINTVITGNIVQDTTGFTIWSSGQSYTKGTLIKDNLSARYEVVKDDYVSGATFNDDLSNNKFDERTISIIAFGNFITIDSTLNFYITKGYFIGALLP